MYQKMELKKIIFQTIIPFIPPLKIDLVHDHLSFSKIYNPDSDLISQRSIAIQKIIYKYLQGSINKFQYFF